jgi:hypothetical protein
MKKLIIILLFLMIALLSCVVEEFDYRDLIHNSDSTQVDTIPNTN